MRWKLECKLKWTCILRVLLISNSSVVLWQIPRNVAYNNNSTYEEACNDNNNKLILMPKIFNFTVNNVDHYDQYLDQNNDLKSRNCDQDDDFTLIMIDTVTKMMVKITQSLLMTNPILLLLLLEKREKKKKKNTKFVLLLTTNFILHLLKFSILLFNPILLKKRKFVSLLMLNPILNVLLLTNCVLLLI